MTGNPLAQILRGWNPQLLVSGAAQGGVGGGTAMNSMTNYEFTPGGSTTTINMGGQDSSLLAMLAALGGMGQTKQQQAAPALTYMDPGYMAKYGANPTGTTGALPSGVTEEYARKYMGYTGGTPGGVRSYSGAGPGSGGLGQNPGSPGGTAISSGGRRA